LRPASAVVQSWTTWDGPRSHVHGGEPHGLGTGGCGFCRNVANESQTPLSRLSYAGVGLCQVTISADLLVGMPVLSKFIRSLSKVSADEGVKEADHAEAAFSGTTSKNLLSLSNFQNTTVAFADVKAFAEQWNDIDSIAKDVYARLVLACERLVQNRKDAVVAAGLALTQKLEDFAKKRLDDLAGLPVNLEQELAKLDSACKVVVKSHKATFAAALNSNQAKDLYKEGPPHLLATRICDSGSQSVLCQSKAVRARGKRQAPCSFSRPACFSRGRGAVDPGPNLGRSSPTQPRKDDEREKHGLSLLRPLASFFRQKKRTPGSRARRSASTCRSSGPF